jgi:two-component system sensor histidine kinase AlgZ
MSSPDTSPPTGQSKSHLAYWILQLSGWGVFTLLRLYAAVAVLDLPWARAAVELLLLDGAGLGLTHWLRNFAGHHGWSALPLRRLTWRIVAAGFILGTPLGIITQLTELSALQGPLPGEEYAPALLLAIQYVLNILNWAFLFMIWLAIYFTAAAVRRHRSAELRQSELARALQQAELRLLKTQLNPHFLFNALNTVRSLIADDPSRAQGAVTRLANTLRYTLSSGQDELVTLAQELEIVADYLELESMRFEDRLRVEYDVAPGAGSVHIPVMLLQTVVENAIKHGIADLPGGGVLRISAALRDGMLVLEVQNPRPPAPARAAHEGIGLRNADERLRLLFGTQASLDLDMSQPAVATVRIRIPQHR